MADFKFTELSSTRPADLKAHRAAGKTEGLDKFEAALSTTEANKGKSSAAMDALRTSTATISALSRETKVVSTRSPRCSRWGAT